MTYIVYTTTALGFVDICTLSPWPRVVTQAETFE